jgi:hypothetical protein
MIIEEGKFYLARCGEKIGPMRKPGVKEDWVDGIEFASDIRGWYAGGRYFENCESEFDLIDTWTEPAGSALDPVNQPAHYTGHPSGVECIQITEHMSFCRGNAMKYIWRAGEKGDEVQDLEKAIWYLQREIGLIRAKSA